MAAEGIDGERLADTRRAGDADADGFSGLCQKRLDELVCLVLVIGALALDQGDGARQHSAVAVADAASESGDVRIGGHGAMSFRSGIAQMCCRRKPFVRLCHTETKSPGECRGFSFDHARTLVPQLTWRRGHRRGRAHGAARPGRLNRRAVHRSLGLATGISGCQDHAANQEQDDRDGGPLHAAVVITHLITHKVGIISEVTHKRLLLTNLLSCPIKPAIAAFRSACDMHYESTTYALATGRASAAPHGR